MHENTKKLRNSCEAILVQVGRHSSRKHKKHCGIRARRFRAKWKDTLADWRVRENTKNWKNSRKAISSQVEGHTPADFEGARNHKKLRNSRKAISVEVERHSSRFGGARKHKNTAEFSSQVQGHSSRLEDGQKHKKTAEFAQGDFEPGGEHSGCDTNSRLLISDEN